MAGRKGFRKTYVIIVTCLVTAIFMLFNILSLQDDINKSSQELAEKAFAYSRYDNSLQEKNRERHTLQRPVLVPIELQGDAKNHIILVTLIPRSGIKVFEKIFAKLKTTKSFKVISSSERSSSLPEDLYTEKQRKFCEKVSTIAQRSVVYNPYAYINCTRFHVVPPVLVSVVREPVERAISTFYFARSAFAIVEQHNRYPEQPFPTRKYLKKALEECLSSENDTECSYKQGEIRSGMNIQYFCGHESYCKEMGNLKAFERAKKAASTYAVIGILEHWDITLRVLESYVPDFFQGAQSAYEKLLPGDKNTNVFKPKVDSKSRKILEDRLYLEREFYKFLVNKLNTQYSNIITQ